MTNINKQNLEKYALNYLKRYASSKKNLKIILNRKIKKFGSKKLEDIEQYKNDINDIIDNLERKNILNDEIFANSKIYNYANLGKSKKAMEYNLIKKGIDKKEIQKVINNMENDIPDLELRSAEIFARKRKLGKYSLVKKEKEKELSKMSRAGFSYSIALKALGYN